ncbi:hypothetical protein FisN_11Lh060 [Fistulifera solaris]|uniref:HSF-type DNA-binding domain-containing protein n=1 Tax=Fistulifera solaris TaxID=1519565 RepID=A0A1Z5J7R5_FISSO|nr:hypothetical protein FisN_11Lh060 [Fistulifera solaris]|eukprot:GAX09952.1 hypothetical protein FisN_11Lh060 [Fistulifera solaris]
MSSLRKKTIHIPTEKRKKTLEVFLNDEEGKALGGDDISSGGVPSHSTNELTGDGQNNVLSLISPEVRSILSTPAKSAHSKSSSFVETTMEMINFFSKDEPSLMGWGDDGQHFYVNTHANLGRVCSAMKPFFDHGNFSSFRRQLCAYNFIRVQQGRYRGHWYHPLFHRFSTEQNIREIQSSRRRRGQGVRTSNTLSQRSRRIKIRQPGDIVQSTPSSVGTDGQSGFCDFPGSEYAHMLVLDSVASLFPLESLAKDEVLNGGLDKNNDIASSNVIQQSQKGSKVFESDGSRTSYVIPESQLKTESDEDRPVSSYLSCSPIKQSIFNLPMLRSAFSPPVSQGGVSELVDCYGDADGNKENLTQESNLYQSAFGQFSPATPGNLLSMFQRSSPFGYEFELTRLFCSPYRQCPGAIPTETHEPILFSFHGNPPATGLTSTNILKEFPGNQLDPKHDHELDSKPAAVKSMD